MSDFQQIEADGRKFAAQFSGFLKCAEAFGRIGSIEQAEGEAKARLQAIRAQEIQARAELETVSERVASAMSAERAKADAEVAGASARANDIIKKADDEAARITRAAHSDAATIKGSAQKTAQEHHNRVEAAKGELSALDRAIADKRGALDELSRRHSAASDEHAALVDKHAAFKRSIGLGG